MKVVASLETSVGKVRRSDSVESQIPLPLKMESLLETAGTQRRLTLEILRRRGKVNVVDAREQIEEDDMKDMYNRWRWDADSWMNTKTFTK